jgi:cob(I)alamin adenosyltransferase
MGNRLSKIVTRTGDDGTTGLGDGKRVSKDAVRIEAMGTVDELNCALGVLIAQPMPRPLAAEARLLEIQQELFDLGGELALPGVTLIDAAGISRLEESIEQLNATLPPLREFVLPGGNPAAAACHNARAVCRRAERRCWTLAREESVNPASLRYLNRLSDLLFVLARTLARADGGAELLWRGKR